jgi:hypothetical protein
MDPNNSAAAALDPWLPASDCYNGDVAAHPTKRSDRLKLRIRDGPVLSRAKRTRQGASCSGFRSLWLAGTALTLCLIA